MTMKANRMHVFGGPEVILFEDVPRPTPGTGEALVTSFRTGSVQTNWMRIPDMPSMIQVATNPAATAPATRNRSANASPTPCAIMITRAPDARRERPRAGRFARL